ncbi:DUF6691 family protein [Salinisphaera sp. SPP-AMP-43]|uniref:DUF6691 family protein n=1 Tax=Salinisphaera sp. SPP-AMP-43 TaxID=3121288 RepID=UPI003C6DE22D
MTRHLIAAAAGLMFGFGLCLSHMADPNKVLAFLDIVGGWDPSLALVMIGAVMVTIPAFARLRHWRRPWAGQTMHWPTATHIDRRLVLGAALFGLGWGIAGYCPGPAVAALTFNPKEALIFVAALLIGGRLAGRFTG